MDTAQVFLIFVAFVALLVFLSLGLTALFRPDHLRTLIEAYKVLALALIGKRYSDRNLPPDEDEAGKAK
jgi:hypothetical protein